MFQSETRTFMFQSETRIYIHSDQNIHTLRLEHTYTQSPQRSVMFSDQNIHTLSPCNSFHRKCSTPKIHQIHQIWSEFLNFFGSEIQILRYLAVQIQIEILVSFEFVPRNLKFLMQSILGMQQFQWNLSHSHYFQTARYDSKSPCNISMALLVKHRALLVGCRALLVQYMHSVHYIWSLTICFKLHTLESPYSIPRALLVGCRALLVQYIHSVHPRRITPWNLCIPYIGLFQ